MQPISALFEEFTGTTLNTTKWLADYDLNTGSATSGSSYSVSGGAVTVSQGNSTNYYISTKDSFTWDNSQITWGPITGTWFLQTTNGRVRVAGTTLYLDNPFGGGTSMAYNATTMKYFKLVTTTTTNTLYYSANNYNWTSAGTLTVYVTGSTLPIRFTVGASGQNFTLGAINPLPNAEPNVSIISPGDLTTLTSSTPVLSFEGINPDADKVTYQLQVATMNTFTSTIVDVLSTSPTGWSGGTDPYNSGATISYTLQTALTSGGVPYYWRVRAKDPAGKNVFGPWSTIYTMISEPNPPTVTSVSTSAITATTLTASGNVTADGGGVITERGVAYGTSSNPTISGTKQVVGGTTGEFNAPITGLTANTVYNWRAYATNSKTTSYGSNLTFTTLPGTATVNTVTSITNSGATISSTVPANGGATITERGVVYSTVANPTIANSKVTSGTGSGTYNTNITGLTGNSIYYVRAYATNASGTSYSTQTSFTTLQDPSAPTVLTGTYANVDEVTADVNGSTVTLNGTQTVTERGIVISSTTDDPTIADRKVIAGTAGMGSYDVSIDALEPETTYYARAYATNSLGTGYGSVVSFTTLALFIPDDGDGYWTWRPSGSDANISRSQSTPANSSANLLLADLNLEDGEEYTLWYSAIENDEGSPRMVLQWYDSLKNTASYLS